MRTLLPLLLLLAAAAPAPAQDDVTIYRCTDADGRLALQDFPCADDEQQQVRTMVRPQDPPPRPAPAPSAASTPEVPEPRAVEVIVRQPPRPMYECFTPDGERYTSDSGEGNPRQAPAWNWGGGYWAGPAPGVPPGPSGSAQRRASGIASPGMSTSPGPSLTAPARSRSSAPPPPRPHPRHRPAWGYPGGGGWVRDECHPLPQSRVCELLTQRRSELGRRIFNAQPSQRAVLREEERDINARLAQDCGQR